MKEESRGFGESLHGKKSQEQEESNMLVVLLWLWNSGSTVLEFCCLRKLEEGATLKRRAVPFTCVGFESQSMEKSSQWLKIPLNYKSN